MIVYMYIYAASEWCTCNHVHVHVCALSASPHAVHVIIKNDYNYLILILILIIINVHVHVCCGTIFCQILHSWRHYTCTCIFIYYKKCHIIFQKLCLCSTVFNSVGNNGWPLAICQGFATKFSVSQSFGQQASTSTWSFVIYIYKNMVGIISKYR